MKPIYLTAMFSVYVIALLGFNKKYRSSILAKLSTLIIFCILFLISGFRSPASIGDTYFYSHSYKLLVENTVLSSDAKDIGFNMLTILLTKITSDPQALIIYTAFITNLFVILALYKYGKPFELSVFLYFATVIYYVTMNGIRQSMVAAILFFSVHYLINNKWKQYFILVILMSTFHESALLFLLLYFIVKKEAWSRSFWLVMIISFSMIVLFRPMISIVVSFLEKTSYSNYGKDMISNNASVNLIRVAVMAVPLILSYPVRDKMKASWPESNIFIFMSLFNFIFMLFSTQYLFFYRLCMYFELYNLVLIPRLLQFYDKRKRTILYVFILIFYSIFCWYQVSGWSDYYKNILF